MKKHLLQTVRIAAMLSLTAAGMLSATSCGDKTAYPKGVPEKYYALLDDALYRAGNEKALRKALKQTPEKEREGMAYLISYMPQGDLDTMNTSLLRDNVKYAYMARNIFPWAQELPDSLFLNEVLPYACVDETRDEWRRSFWEIFSPRVKDCATIEEAIEAVNRNINKTVAVEYNTKRRKTNQSPRESMPQHMASCTGLSILLADAFRSVGIPARFAGTPAWHDDRGNHSWVEVWIDGEWKFTEFYPTRLNQAWFLADAGKGDSNDREHAIYATSWRPTGDYFPMAWSPEAREVHGTNVTDRYVKLYAAERTEMDKAGNHVPVKLTIMKNNQSDCTCSDERVAVNVDVFRNGEQVAGGRTSGPARDMNDILTFHLEKGHQYVMKYENAAGTMSDITFTVSGTPIDIVAYYEPEMENVTSTVIMDDFEWETTK